MAKRKASQTDVQQSEYIRQLHQRFGNSYVSVFDEVDAQLIAMAVMLLTRKKAGIQFGTSKDGATGILTVYDGDYPFKQYVNSAEHANSVLAGIVLIYAPKDAAYDSWRALAEKYQ